MSESGLWNEMRNNIGHLGHFSRVESGATSAGIPDVDFCLDLGFEGHIELKFADLGCEAKPRTLKKNFVRPTQVKWFRNRAKAGSISNWIFAKFIRCGKPHYLLFTGYNIENLAKTNKPDDWVLLANYVWHDEMNWKELVNYLTKK